LKETHKLNKQKLKILTILLMSVVLNASGQILFKSAFVGVPVTFNSGTILTFLLNPGVWGGLILYGISAICWLWVLSRVQLSYAYPVLALSFPLVVGGSYLFFGESVSFIRWGGVGIIMLGVSLLART
jgi:drug/metabolite transporter (DMT)-like permease